MPSDIQRLHYTPRQFLGSADMADEQTYLRDMRRRHNLGPHTWGIVVGLELEERPRLGSPDEVDVYVKPGLAIDGFGREIVVAAPYKLDTAEFAAFGSKRYVDVWIAYDEELLRRAGAGYQQCAATEQFTRIRERSASSPRRSRPPMIRSWWMVSPRSAAPTPTRPTRPRPSCPMTNLRPSRSYPMTPTSPRWFVRLGSVNWDGGRKPPAFVRDTNNRLLEERGYAGLVGAHLLAPAASLTIRDRSTPTPLPNDEEGACRRGWKGSLRVDRLLTAKRDIQVHGGKIDFREAGGTDGGAPFALRRATVDNGLKGNDLRAAIGATADGKQRFVVGPEQADTLDIKFAVRNDGEVRMNGPAIITGQTRMEGGLSIKGIIDFDDVPGDRLMLWGAADQDGAYGFGIENGTLYARAGSCIAGTSARRLTAALQRSWRLARAACGSKRISS